MTQLNSITVTDINELFTFFSPKGKSEEIQNRKSYGLSFCIKGKITYAIKEKQVISDESHVVILPKGQSYSLHIDETVISPVINFDCTDFLCDYIISLPIQSSHIYIKNYEIMKSLSLFEENRTKIMSIFYGMLHRLSLENSVRNQLIPAIKHIERNFQNPKLTNAELAEKCIISEVYFRKLFAESYKTTPKQYLIDIRLNRAKQLLSEGVLKVSAVAEQCGFTNQYHFCRIFKEKTGLTPTEYIKRNKIYKI